MEGSDGIEASRPLSAWHVHSQLHRTPRPGKEGNSKSKGLFLSFFIYTYNVCIHDLIYLICPSKSGSLMKILFCLFFSLSYTLIFASVDCLNSDKTIFLKSYLTVI